MSRRCSDTFPCFCERIQEPALWTEIQWCLLLWRIIFHLRFWLPGWNQFRLRYFISIKSKVNCAIKIKINTYSIVQCRGKSLLCYTAFHTHFPLKHYSFENLSLGFNGLSRTKLLQYNAMLRCVVDQSYTCKIHRSLTHTNPHESEKITWQ